MHERQKGNATKLVDMSTSTLYQVLRVRSSASTAEIKKAFRDLARTHHPDTGGSSAAFRLIHEAYQVLSKPSSRKLYDLELNTAGGHSKTYSSSSARHHPHSTHQAQGKGWTMRPGGYNRDEWERGHGLGKYSRLHEDVDIGSVSGFATKNSVHVIRHKLDSSNLNDVQQYYRRKDAAAASNQRGKK